MKKFAFVIFLWVGLVHSIPAQKIYLAKLDASINPATADYLISAIGTAEKNNAECIVIEFNTPGGLLESTRKIVTKILSSEIPVVVYVFPAGSRAASAGVFITMSAHIAAMAPGTNIGAAHPVILQGQMDSVMSGKVTNDAAAFIRSISKARGRNYQWAEKAVRQSLSITETEALKKNVIDFIAKDFSDLLEKLNGRKISTKNGLKVIHSKGAVVVTVEMNFRQEFLNLISEPNIAYIFLMLGIYGLLFELYNPGAILPGVVGVIGIILGFYSMNTLPINYAGLALILFGIILFILEIKIPSHGILSVGGTISLILGSIMLIDIENSFGILKISWEVILLITALTVAFFSFAIGLGLKAQRKKPTTGVEGMKGSVGFAEENLSPKGRVDIHGEIWNAISTEGKIKKGEKIVVVDFEGLTLKVKKNK